MKPIETVKRVTRYPTNSALVTLFADILFECDVDAIEADTLIKHMKSAILDTLKEEELEINRKSNLLQTFMDLDHKK